MTSDPIELQDTNNHLVSDSRRIYILGVGNIGSFVAHSLAGIPNRPPITLLFRTRLQVRRWDEHDRCLKVTTHEVPETRWGFDIETSRDSQTDPLSNSDERSEDHSASSRAKNAFSADSQNSQTSRNHRQSTERIHQKLSGEIDTESSHLAEFENSSTSDVAFMKSRRSDASSHLREDVTGTDAEHVASDSVNDHDGGPEGEDRDAARTNFGPDESIIYNLIVTVKAPHTVTALQSWAHRLTTESTILFLQNGMGILDEVNQKVFPDEKTRPQYMLGILSHGVYNLREYEVVHAGQGTIALGMTLQSNSRGSPSVLHLSDAAPSSKYLMRTMTRTPVFVAVGFAPTDLLQQQLDKLAVNAIINPLTAVLDCKNGALLSNFHFTRVMRLLLAEISLVIQSLPELQNVPNVAARFDTARLERLVVSIANSTAQNTSSMLEDVKKGMLTESEYITGYIVRRGEELGIQCVVNYMLMHLVKGKSNTVSWEKEGMVPFSEGRKDNSTQNFE